MEKLIYDTDEYKNIEKQFKIQTEEFIITNNSFLPKVTLDINVPTYDHSITVITQPNGDDRFIDRRQANSSFVFDISQPITFSGGYVNIKSSINRIDIITSKDVNYSSNWINATLVQPLNGFNQFKWIKRINKSKFKSNSLNFKRSIEELKLNLIDKYFEILILKYKTQLTTRNVTLKENKLVLTNELLNAGKILLTEQLQEQISLNQLKVSLESQNADLKDKYHEFKNLLELKNEDIELVVPTEIELHNIDEKNLKQRIIEYGVNQLFETNKIISERDFIKAKRERGIQTSLQLAYGLNSSNNDLSNLYEVPSQKEFFNFKISIPLLNWNENKRKLFIAKEQKELIDNEYKIAMENVDVKVSQISNYLKSLSNQKNYLKKNIDLTKKNIEIITYQYKSNRITTNDFDYEVFKEMSTNVDYLYNLKDNWTNLYNIRRVTLFDYYSNKDLIK